MANEGILLGMGNPLLDISAVVPEEFLKKYDVKPNNAILAEDKHLPIYRYPGIKYKDCMMNLPTNMMWSLLLELGLSYCFGFRCYTKFIKVAQWMLQIPGATSYMGSIGKDKFGEEMKKNCKQAVLMCTIMKMKLHLPELVLSVFLWSLIANLSAANCYKTEHLKQPENWALGNMLAIGKAKYIHCWFFLTVSPESIQLVAAHAAANNKVFTMNLSAHFICEFFKDAQEKLCRTWITFLEMRLKQERLQGSWLGGNTENVEEIAVKISQLPKQSGTHKRTTVITQGADPVVVAEDGRSNCSLLFGMHLLVDFCHSIVKEKPIEDCVKAGCYAANVIIQRSRCTYPEKPDFE
ncbi:hypothetical protein G4B88_009239 [Cannabis sativa]|uniref:Adenosine kinase n=1 Tax=Cannabis sativa TaxID=3483 RepID=A0A7J6ETV8_CANSA|nr:hypothetical protein G4B88_009239 [Cannabis sativa]